MVLAVGDEVRDFQPGDYVACHDYETRANGSYAEQVVCRADKTVLVPADLPPEQAVAVLLQALTAWALGYGAYAIKKGDRVLIHTGAGGVGILLTQIARLEGAEVIATVGSEAKRPVAEAAGANLVINYAESDFAAKVMAATAGEGVNAVFDSVGRATFLKNFECLAPLGTVAVYGSASGPAEPFTPPQTGSSGAYVTNANMLHHVRPKRPGGSA